MGGFGRRLVIVVHRCECLGDRGEARLQQLIEALASFVRYLHWPLSGRVYCSDSEYREAFLYLLVITYPSSVFRDTCLDTCTCTCMHHVYTCIHSNVYRFLACIPYHTRMEYMYSWCIDILCQADVYYLYFPNRTVIEKWMEETTNPMMFMQPMLSRKQHECPTLLAVATHV